MPEVEREGLGEGLGCSAPPEARSSSLTTTWVAPASCSPEARLPASPCGEGRVVSTQGPPSGLRPAARRMSSPRPICAPISLGDAGPGERGQVDGHVGLVEELVAAERGQLVERVLAPWRAAGRLPSRAHGERGGHVAVRGQRGRPVSAPPAETGRRRHPQRPAGTGPRRRALVGEEGGEARQRGTCRSARGRPTRGRRRSHSSVRRRAAQRQAAGGPGRAGARARAGGWCSLGSTVTQVAAVRPAAGGGDGDVGSGPGARSVCPSDCWSWDASSMRP